MARSQIFKIGDHCYNPINLQIIWIAAKDKVDTTEISKRIGYGTVTVRQNYRNLLKKWNVADISHYEAIVLFQKFLEKYEDKVKEIFNREKIKAPTVGDCGVEQLKLFD